MDPFWILAAGMLTVVGGILLLRLNAFLALLAGALLVGVLTPKEAVRQHALTQGATLAAADERANQPVGLRIAERFGATAGKIGILIAMAAIIGRSLLESGAADRIVRSALKSVGEKRAPVAFLGSGFTLAIPVFFDTVFYLLIPLGKAMGLRNPSRYGFYVLAIVAGATMAHSLVPPTPGPLFVASEFGVSVGLMMMGGLTVGLCAVTAGYWFAKWLTTRWPVPLRLEADASLADLEAASRVEDAALPPLWLSILPIVLPVVLIGGDSILNSALGESGGTGAVAFAAWWFEKLGDKNIALIIAAAIALGALAWTKRASRESLARTVESSLMSGGLIILITSAGGAFGGLLQQTGIGARVQDLAAAYQIAVLPLAFGVAAIVRTAQGSATVAMITSAGILAPLAGSADLQFHPLYIALAIGCGSKPIPWMNDSGFWIVCKMSGMTEKEVLRTFTLTLTVMGGVGLLATMILARIAPLAP